jgi:cation transport ATPase
MMNPPEAGNGSVTDSNERFRLPSGDIEHGRSQPKRTAPRRRESQQLLKRLALGLATFIVSLGLVALFYGVVVSPEFRGLTLENGTTAAVALLIGCFTLPSAKRIALNRQVNLLVCIALLAITPWTYQLGNEKELAGMSLAPGFNFVFEILLAVTLYRIASIAGQR